MIMRRTARARGEPYWRRQRCWPPRPRRDTFTLTSPDIAPGGRIAEAQVFNGFGCKGGNVSPALAGATRPPGTKSFALLVHDPDAPTGSGWWHWVVYNIPGRHELAARRRR